MVRQRCQGENIKWRSKFREFPNAQGEELILRQLFLLYLMTNLSSYTCYV